MGRFNTADDLIHDLDGLPHGRESLLWTVPLPDHELLVFAYAWRDAATERYGRFVAVSADDGGQPLHLSFDDDLPLQGDDLDDCSIGGLAVCQPEPLHTAAVAYRDREIEYEATFEGLHEPFSWHEGASGCPSWAALDRYEQSCRVSGRLRLGDRAVDINGFGHRDHSWGTRDWRALQHWKWINAGGDDGVSLHAWMSFALGDRQVNGYVNRRGEVSAIRDLDVHAELDDRLLHTRVTAMIVDEGGETTTLEAWRRAVWQMPIRHLYLNEAAMAAEIDGRPATAHVELGWPQAYVQDYVEEPGS